MSGNIYPSFGLSGATKTRGISGTSKNGKNALDVNIVAESSAASPATQRAAAILTTGYVATTPLATDGAKRVTYYIDFTKGSLDSAEVQFVFGPTAADLYTLTDESISSGTTTCTIDTHVLSATGKYRFTYEINDMYIGVQIKGTGTVTGSSAKIIALLG